jgi:glycosyltransferase involved in cell wall biosynthesis
MKKLLVITTTFPRWKDDKITNFIYELAVEHTKEYEVHVLAPHSKNSMADEIMDEIHVHRFRYFFNNLENLSQGISILNAIKQKKSNILLVPLFFTAGSFKIFLLMQKYHFNIVHNHWLIPFSPVTALCKYFFKYKLIITSHGSDVLGFSEGILGKLIQKTSRFAIGRCDYYTVVSSEIKRIAEERFKFDFRDKLRIISMGIPYKQFSKVKPNFERDLFTIIFVGRLTELKGTNYLLEAVRILKNQGITFRCKIIGDGPERRNLENLTEQLKIANQVKFIGFVPHKNIPEHLNDAGVFVGPSITTEDGYKEGFGLVFVEAMAAGLPVIGSRSGGITDIVKHMETGLLVEEKDSEQIAECIKELYGNISLRERLIMNGKKIAENYSWPKIANQYSELYEN